MAGACPHAGCPPVCNRTAFTGIDWHDTWTAFAHYLSVGAEALGQVTYETLAPSPAEFDALFDEAIGVEARSWKREAGSAIAVDRLRETFFRRFFRAAAADGRFRLSFLRVDGEAVNPEKFLRAGLRLGNAS